jgi:two-component system, NarL family, response regulator NreC
MGSNLHLGQPLDADDSRSASSPIKVVLADDHRVVRRDLRLLLQTDKGVEVIAEAGDLFTAMRHVNVHRPQVLLLDLRMPNGSSIEAIRRLRAQAPETGIIVVTMEDSPAFARKAIDIGAVGYVLKDHADSELPVAIRCAARGEEYVSPRVAAGLDALRRAEGGDRLSPRETEVLRLTALGFTSAEIADQLHLSTRTVESHRTRIQHKLGLAKRYELVRYALERHLIGWPPDVAHGAAPVSSPSGLDRLAV